ncbi:copper resistance CopC family protein [Priestia flexa]|uniref:copper resistance CopC family protein n=1 Tax=Priestia flexa TaxID=86664 RepID=UPI00240DC9C9|nr:copper resistance CopC family protein [Priestia flexa]WEZ06775.1 copper resistance protein CopC [Priestia flexa]
MRKIMMFLMVMLLTLPTVSFAHTHVQTTVPENGATVTSQLTEIKLSFETHIEKVSTLTVTKDGQELSIDSQEVSGHDLIGTFEEPLPNGEYEVKWNIVGEDGHVMEDAISFTVNADQEEVTSENKDTQKESATEEAEKSSSPDEQTEAESTSENSSFFVIMIVAVVIVATALIFVFRKKKG